jgi:hypothetical protein
MALISITARVPKKNKRIIPTRIIDIFSVIAPEKR